MANFFFCRGRVFCWNLTHRGPLDPRRSLTVHKFSAILFVLKNKSCCKLVIWLVFNIIFHFYKKVHGWKLEFGELWPFCFSLWRHHFFTPLEKGLLFNFARKREIIAARFKILFKQIVNIPNFSLEAKDLPCWNFLSRKHDFHFGVFWTPQSPGRISPK